MLATCKQKLSALKLSRNTRTWHHISSCEMSSSRQNQAVATQDPANNVKPLVDALGQMAVPFAHAKLGSFFQARPVLHNQYLQDSLLVSYLRRHVSTEHWTSISADLEQFGDRVAGEIYNLSLQMEAEQPRLEQIDAWGNRVDQLITSSAWKKMKEISAEEGLIACGYERKYGEWSRLYQIAKFYLFEPSGGLYGCPLAMTDGAAKTLELYKNEFPALYERAFTRLTSRDPKIFWTSGQWMTEKQGGSDVARGTETIAVAQPDGSYKLFGYKWFSSATDADMSLTLARVVGQDGSVLELSEEGRGVASMANMLTLTRIHTAMGAASAMRRIVTLARDYATRRVAFGKLLHRQTLHVHTLAGMEVETRAAAIFVFEISRLLGRQEVLPRDKTLEAESEVLRLLVPLAKLYVSKQAVAVVSEGLESFGGQGYIEDTDLPRILRDTQVNAIWEGTTNILSLDVLRAINKSAGSVLNHFRNSVLALISSAKEHQDLQAPACRVEKAMQDVLQFATKLPQNCVEMAAREFAYSLARIYMGALLLEHAGHHGATPSDVYTAQRWCEKDLSPLCTHGDNGSFTEGSHKGNMELIFDGYLEKSRL
ncbi:hypothetical protein BsWGS_07686 [Bradybaena similaris]